MSGALKQVQRRLEAAERQLKIWWFGSARVEPPKAESANSSRGARLPILGPDRTTAVIMKQRRGHGALVGAGPASDHFPLPIVTPRKMTAPSPPT